jgi:hypothetical protein
MANCWQPTDKTARFLAVIASPAKKPKISFCKLLSKNRLLQFLKHNITEIIAWFCSVTEKMSTLEVLIFVTWRTSLPAHQPSVIFLIPVPPSSAPAPVAASATAARPSKFKSSPRAGFAARLPNEASWDVSERILFYCRCAMSFSWIT